MDADAVWAQAESLAQVPSEGRVAMVDLARPADPPMVLEGTAAAIWSAVDGRRTVAEVVAAVAEAYDLASEEIHGDVVDFLTDLAERGLVRRHAEA